MSKSSFRSAVVGGVVGALFVGVMGPVAAAVGDALRIGEVNTGHATTTLKGRSALGLQIVTTSEDGTALELRVQRGNPPLTVNSGRRVRYLNADKLDGLHARAFLPAAVYDADGNQRADWADNADRLDGVHSSAFLFADEHDTDKDRRIDYAQDAGDADTVDGRHAVEFLPRTGTARDARHADDADTVGGYAPNELLRVTQASTSNAPDRDGNAVQASITAPGPGWLIVSGSIDGRGNEYDIYACHLRVDGTTIVGSPRASTVDLNVLGGINDEENCSTDGVISVDAGDHTVALWVGRTADKATFGPASVWALYVPFNGQGNPYVP